MGCWWPALFSIHYTKSGAGGNTNNSNVNNGLFYLLHAIFIFDLAMEKIIYHPEFVTATIVNWYPLLKQRSYKKIILGSLQYLVKKNKIIVYAYCIMDNHIHIIWHIKGEKLLSDVRRDFFKYTAQKIKDDLEKYNPELLSYFKSTQADREYHFWERNPECKELFTDDFFEQKFNYIHKNPVEAGICALEEDYEYSSAKFYLTGEDKLGLLTHYRG